MDELVGKSAIVTGGSRGYGAGIAKALKLSGL
jgi:NAD(P)-dependent dehydrogenase (short-subunit alcohol dehydrogenase family)